MQLRDAGVTVVRLQTRRNLPTSEEGAPQGAGTRSVGFDTSQLSSLSAGVPVVESMWFPGGILDAAALYTSAQPHRDRQSSSPAPRAAPSRAGADPGLMVDLRMECQGEGRGLWMAEVPCCAGRFEFLGREVFSRLVALSLAKIDWIHPPGTGAPEHSASRGTGNECQIASQLRRAAIIDMNILPDPFEAGNIHLE